MVKCDFCEEEDETASFDPEWDAVVCDECTAEMENEHAELMDNLRKQSKEGFDGN